MQYVNVHQHIFLAGSLVFEAMLHQFSLAHTALRHQHHILLTVKKAHQLRSLCIAVAEVSIGNLACNDKGICVLCHFSRFSFCVFYVDKIIFFT